MSKFLRVLTGAVLALGALGAAPAVAQSLYSLDRDTGDLYELSSTDASYISSTSITMPGQVVTGGSGLAFHPASALLYGLISLENQPLPELVTIDIGTGLATSIGTVSDMFTGLSFAQNGTLYGVTSDEAATPEALYTINTLTGSTSLVMLLEEAGFGEAIGIHRGANDLYRASDIIGGHLYQRIDLDTLATTDITPSGDDYFEAQAMTWAGGNQFFMSDLDGNVYRFSTTGNAELIGTLGLRGGGGPGPGESFISKGLAYVVPIPEPTSILMLAAAGTLLMRRRR
jgi:hypothetical protein